MGNMCTWFEKDKRIHNAVDAAFREFKKELLECVRAELTASRSQESEPGIQSEIPVYLRDPITRDCVLDIIPSPPRLIRQ